MKAPVACQRLPRKLERAKRRITVALAAQDKPRPAVGQRSNSCEPHPRSNRHALAVEHFAGNRPFAQETNVRHRGLTVE